MFFELTEEEKTLFAPELMQSDKILVKFENKYWFVKSLRPPEHKKPDYLGWLIGKALVNVAEVRVLTPEEITQLVLVPTLSQIGSTITHENTYLIRLANSYLPEELILKTNDEAIAFELVFSVWIRRRDAHAHNRIYLHDVPIFFDHQTAFLGEQELSTISIFFQDPPADHGRASAWRLVIRGREIKTMDGRNIPFFNAAQFVHKPDDFYANIELAVRKIEQLNVDSYLETIKSAGFTEEEAQQRIIFLKNNQNSLSQDIQIMKTTLLKPFYFWDWILT